MYPRAGPCASELYTCVPERPAEVTPWVLGELHSPPRRHTPGRKCGVISAVKLLHSSALWASLSSARWMSLVSNQTPAHQGAILLRLGLGRKNARLIQSPQIKTGKFTEEETPRRTAVPFLKSPN